MIEETGRVVAVEHDVALIETQRRNACDSCAVNKGCGTGVISKLFGQRFTQVKALNKVGAKVDDEVIVGLYEQALVRGSLAVYMVPLIFMFAMALLGQVVATDVLGMESGEGMSIIFALLGLGLGFLWVKRFSQKISTDERYQPVILRRAEAAANTATVQFQN